MESAVAIVTELEQNSHGNAGVEADEDKTYDKLDDIEDVLKDHQGRNMVSINHYIICNLFIFTVPEQLLLVPILDLSIPQPRIQQFIGLFDPKTLDNIEQLSILPIVTK